MSALARGYWFECSACGKCCDSAPVLGLPELFRGQERFLGCLGIRRVRRFRVGETVGHGRGPRALEPDDVAALEAIARRCLHRTRSGPLGDDVLLALHGFDEPGLGRCPALGEDARCTLHGEQKPLECRAVPLDPLIPDRLQGLVLDARADEPVFSGAGCLTRAPRAGALQLVDDARFSVADLDARSALRARREALAFEKRFWAKAVFERLERDLFAHPSRFGQVPFRGFLVMSAAPAVLTIAAASGRVRRRCREFVERQIALGERRLASAGPSPELEAITHNNRLLLRELAKEPAHAGWPALEREALEAWLGLERSAAATRPRDALATG